MSDAPEWNASCPMPVQDESRILIAHGGGGRRTQRLIERLFAAAFRNPALDARHDGAILETAGARLAFTTDAYVVRPLFFPGGDIGSLAVNGTINDLAMCGAWPLGLSAAFVLEEGFATPDLGRVVESMRSACEAVGAPIVTGDTKVVERGKGDGLYICTSGVGVVAAGVEIAPTRVRVGDVLLLSGDVGRHGVAVMAAREGLDFETTIESDCAPLVAPVFALLDGGIPIRCLRDLTRGGLASALVEIAETAKVAIEIDETAISVREEVRGACEILGFDPLYLANEGRFVAFVPETEVERAVELMRGCAVSASAAVIGRVTGEGEGSVTLETSIGARRIVDMLSGEQLPRIC
jgi:hydrogenase expression/formation protein HypE